MSAKLATPFLNGLKEFPEKRKRDVAEFRKWYDKQAHLPPVSDEYLLLFLHACNYAMEKSKRAAEQYFTIRTNHPALFADRNVFNSNVKAVFDLANMVALPKKTPRGHNALLYSLRDTDCSKFVFADGVKAFCMFNDLRLSEDGLAEGYTVLFDMKGSSVGHFARVTLPALRAYMQYIQDAHPARLREIHILNTASFISHVMKLIQPLINSELMNMLSFHRQLPPEDSIPLEMLPSDYGGQAPSINDLYYEQRKLIEDPLYVEWMIDSGKLVCDNLKRPKKSYFGFFSGPDID